MKTAAVVVSFNSRVDLPACLDALLAAEGSPRVVVVDNASRDGSPQLVRERYGERVELVELAENTGFTGGCNRGLAAVSEAELVAFLNPDVIVGGDCLSEAVSCLKRHPGAAGVAPLLMRPDGETVDSAGQCLDRWSLEVVDRGYGGPLTEELEIERPVLAACGALAIFRTEALEGARLPRGGVWDERLFCFWEDLELGWRLWNGGQEIWSCPSARAVHSRGGGARPGRGPLRWRRPVDLEARIILNKRMVLARHCHVFDLIPRLPQLLARDWGLAAVGILRRPSLAGHLVRGVPSVAAGWLARGRRRRLRLRELPC